jgi:predicted lipase
MKKTGTSNVAVVGHSLGAAIALIDTMFLTLNLPKTAKVRHIGYGLPRVRLSNFLVKERTDGVVLIDGQ